MSKTSNPPDRIYLQWWGDEEPDPWAEIDESDVSWCVDKINDHDVEYVRVTKYRTRKDKP